MSSNFTAHEVATLKSCNLVTVQRACRAGKLPGAHQGIVNGRATWLIPRGSVEAWEPDIRKRPHKTAADAAESE